MILEFGKDKTAIIKGVAILFMIILHCAIPEYWDSPLQEFSNVGLIRFMATFKLCVGIYTFMVGYGYAFSKTKDLKYSLVHIRKLLVPFWTILLCFTLPVCYSQMGGGKILLLNAIGVNSRFNWFSWFVAFYIYAMIVMPFIGKLIDRRPILWSVGSIVILFLCEVALHTFYSSFTENDWTQRLFDCLMQSPCMIFGYLVARKQWFLKIHIPKSKLMSLVAVLLMLAILVIRSLKTAILGFSLDIIYAPLFVFSVLVVANQLNCKPVAKMFTALGNASVYMWFFHALFFTQCTRWLYQPLVAISDSLWIVTLWTIVLTFICSRCIMLAVKKIENKLI